MDGKVFQARGDEHAVTKRHKDGVTRADVDEDRSLFLVSTSATRRSSLARYGGTVPCRHRKTRTESLNYPLWHPQPVKVYRGDVLVLPRRANKS